jgi:hypothetical protein
MASMAVATLPIQKAVADALREQRCRPIALLDRLAKEGYTDSEIRQALSEMLHEHRIELTPQRILQLSATPSL